MPDGHLPFSGGSGPTWNDAMMLGEARRFQANNPNYIPGPGEPDFFGRRPPPTPEELAAQSHRHGRRHRIRAMILAVLAIAFFIGTVIDWVGGHQSYAPSLTLSATFAVLTVYQLFRGFGVRWPPVTVPGAADSPGPDEPRVGRGL